MVFAHPIPLLICLLGRDAAPTRSAARSRGTMEYLLTLPVRRVWVLVAPAVCSTAGAAVLAAALWTGVSLGIATVELHVSLKATQFLPGTMNLFGLTFAMSGLTAFCSSWDHNRWRTMALAVGFYVVSFLLWLVARVWQTAWWLKYLTFLTAFEPQRLILLPDSQAIAWHYNGVLLALGLAGYVVAAVILTFRDIPSPGERKAEARSPLTPTFLLLRHRTPGPERRRERLRLAARLSRACGASFHGLTRRTSWPPGGNSHAFWTSIVMVAGPLSDLQAEHRLTRRPGGEPVRLPLPDRRRSSGRRPARQHFCASRRPLHSNVPHGGVSICGVMYSSGSCARGEERAAPRLSTFRSPSVAWPSLPERFPGSSAN